MRPSGYFLAGYATALAVVGGAILLSPTKDEEQTCLDEPDRTAYIARRPGEPHAKETCIKVIRFGSPEWVPQFIHPLKGRLGNRP